MISINAGKRATSFRTIPHSSLKVDHTVISTFWQVWTFFQIVKIQNHCSQNKAYSIKSQCSDYVLLRISIESAHKTQIKITVTSSQQYHHHFPDCNDKQLRDSKLLNRTENDAVGIANY